MRSIEELKISKGRHLPVSEASIRDLEAQIGFKLPRSYVEFVMSANGGHPELDTFSNTRGEWSVNNFFFINDDRSTESLLWNYRHKWPGIADNLLPFGRDGGGNLFCLDLNESNDAPVVLCAHDGPTLDVVKLADSFEEFIDGLHENPDYI